MLSYRGVSVALLMSFLALAGCDTPERSGTGGDARVRLTANNSSAKFDGYVIHVNAVLASDLTPEVAQGYGITRSENQGLINLVVLQTGENGERPVAGDVKVSASNLTGQLKNVKMRQIVDGASIYYIGVVSVDDRENINFDFDVRPEGSSRMLLLRYSHQFYTE